MEADPANDRLPEGMENACLERPEDRVIPAAVAPRLLVLVAPVPERATVEPGILREERRRGADGSEPPRFLGVEVKLPIAVDRQLPIGKRLRDERSAVWLEGRGGRRMGGGHHRSHGGRRQVGMPAKVGEEADEIAPVARVERLHEPVGHHAATLLDDVDVGLRKCLTGPRRRVTEDKRGVVLALPIAAPARSIGRHHRHGAELGLNDVLRPEERLGDLLVGLFAPELRERRAHVPPMLSHLVTGDAGERMPGEDAGTIGCTRPRLLRLGSERRHDRRVVGRDTGGRCRRFGG